MNVMKVMAADGLSFAVPIDVVAKIMEHFRKRGYYSVAFQNFILRIENLFC